MSAGKVAKIPHLPIESFKVENVQELASLTEIHPNERNRVEELRREKISNDLGRDMLMIIQGIGMEKYTELFYREKISSEVLFALNEEDLKVLGIDCEEDRNTIVNSLEKMSKGRGNKLISEVNYSVPIKYTEDLILASNVLKHLLLLQNYVAFTTLKMKKEKYEDYYVHNNTSAVQMFQLLTEMSIKQTDRINLLLNGNNNSLIECSLKVGEEDAIIEKKLKIKMTKNNNKNNKKILLKTISLIGLTSLAILVFKKLIQTNNLESLHECNVKNITI